MVDPGDVLSWWNGWQGLRPQGVWRIERQKPMAKKATKKKPQDATLAASRRDAKMRKELAALRVDLDVLTARFNEHYLRSRVRPF